MTQKPLAVIAFGGNALAPDAAHLSLRDQYPVVCSLCKTVADIIVSGWNVVLTHGNGPQVGVVMRRVELTQNSVVPMSLDYGVAYTQGAIGSMFVTALRNEFANRSLNREAVAMISHVIVDGNDDAFSHPNKPIGTWYEKHQAERLAAKNKWRITEDSGRGWRRVVPSPRPTGIVQLAAIKTLIANNFVVVTLGGGGIPVVTVDGRMQGVEAVVDKDFASSLLARELNADLLIFPTAVPKVCLGFNTPHRRWLDSMTVRQAEEYCRRGEFPKGSMEPKIRALMEYVDATGNTGVICDTATLNPALNGTAGTQLTR